jgi:hypothetical protein
MVDFTRGPGKILKYDSKRGKFRSRAPFWGLGPGKNYRLSPPLYGPDFILTTSLRKSPIVSEGEGETAKRKPNDLCHNETESRH